MLGSEILSLIGKETENKVIVRVYDPILDVTTYFDVYQVESIGGETVLFAEWNQEEKDLGTIQMKRNENNDGFSVVN